jgi:hypothetical protein
MVFAARCMAPTCRKFMLVEDSDRGKTVNCLICKSPIRVPSESNRIPSPSPKSEFITPDGPYRSPLPTARLLPPDQP